MKRCYCFSGTGHETEDVVWVSVYPIIAALGHDISSTDGWVRFQSSQKCGPEHCFCHEYICLLNLLTVHGSSRLEISNNKRATARNTSLFLFFSFDGTCERPLVLPLAFSRALFPRLLMTSKITTRKTYLKD